MEHWRKNLFITWFTQILSVTGFGFVFPFIPLYIQELGVTSVTELRFWVGVLTAAPSLLMGIMASVFFSRDIHRSFATRSRRSVGWRQCRDLLKVGYPPGLQFANDVLSWSIFVSVLVGAFGRIHLTACTAAMRWMPLSFMPAVGIGIATTALVGRYIGEGSPDVARRRAHLALRLALAYMGLCAAAFWLFRRPMVAIFVKIDPSAGLTSAQAAEQAAEIVRIGGWIMICAAVFQLFDAMAIVYIGALRGAGDTFWPMVATIVLSWLVIVGGGYAMVCFLPHLKSIGPWIAAATYVILLGVLMAWRFESGAWRRIDLLGRAAEGRNP